MKKYPFKFLDAYNKEDNDIFFGQEKATKALYKLVFQSNLILVYGASGTGKTSLIRCGLSNRFKDLQWQDLYIRRGTDINQSMLDTILKNTPKAASVSEADAESELDWFERLLEAETAEAIPENASTANSSAHPVAQALNELYLASFTPIYLIFDQFEELYTLGNTKEQQTFIQTIVEVMKLPLPVKVIFVMREEYLANLYDMELAVPRLRQKKLRVEPMSLQNVKQVILDATVNNPRSNISLKTGQEEEIADRIIEKIREGDINIQLPYLQVFMDRLYEKTSGEVSSRQKEVTLNLDLVNSLGDIGDVLSEFMERQHQQIHRKLVQKFGKLPPDFIWQLLSPFATLDGTKVPIKSDELPSLGKTFKLLQQSISEELIRTAISELEASRILRFRKDEAIYEVAHDTLAMQIAEKRSEEEQALLKAKRIVKEGYTSFLDTKAFLSREQLSYIQPYEEKLSQEIDVWQQAFIQNSKKKRRRQTLILRLAALIIFIAPLVIVWTLIVEKQKREVIQELVVDSLLEDVDDGILDLEYEKVGKKINLATKQEVKNEKIAQRYLELAFWFNETGQYQQAKAFLDSATLLTRNKELLGRLKELPVDTSAALRSTMISLDSMHYESLQKRYYPVMIEVNGGNFTMGCDTLIDSLCQKKAIPHEVSLSDFAIAKYETTWWQYYLFCQATGHGYFRTVNKGNGPASGIIWYDAIEYCNWLSKQQGLEMVYLIDSTQVDANSLNERDKKNWLVKPNFNANGYRLPTEAEWEYAARGGEFDKGYVFSGNNSLEPVAWHKGNSNERPQPAGLKQANELGLHDMSGNIWEWCWDWYDEDYYSNKVEQGLVNDPRGPEQGTAKCMRGGSWYLAGEKGFKTRTRMLYSTTSVNHTVGFRVVRNQ